MLLSRSVDVANKECLSVPARHDEDAAGIVVLRICLPLFFVGRLPMLFAAVHSLPGNGRPIPLRFSYVLLDPVDLVLRQKVRRLVRNWAIPRCDNMPIAETTIGTQL